MNSQFLAVRCSRRALLASGCGLLAAACGRFGAADLATPSMNSAAATYPRHDLLIDAPTLLAQIDDPALRILDCSRRGDYRAGHIPGARHIWWQDTIEINNPVYGMVVGRTGRDVLIRTADIHPDSNVVVYDRSGGVFAARLLWMLQGDSFFNVRLLDGGLQAWHAAGGRLATAEPPDGNGRLTPVSNEEILAHAHDILARLGEPGLLLLDTRTTSERVETWRHTLRQGSIPGSLHLPRNQFLTPGPAPILLRPDDLHARLRAAGAPADLSDSEVIVYGLHGTLAALPWLALTALGAGKVRVYDGSWAEWGASSELPITPLEG
ncbi:MAG: sulfurtransferase [Chloroflexi bacterium]|nr:MAG: sulfurtransferase [Chloroflexota bacterium]